MSITIYSARRIREERRQYDDDDRARCECVADHRLDKTLTRCLNSTRHPSGICIDCRVISGRVRKIR
jgi:hypothetical protein